MVTLKVISDVHTEFHADKGVEYCKSLKSDDVEVLVIAGDFCTWTTNDHSRLVFKNLQHFDRIVYVPGNHEYWHAGPAYLMSARFRKLEREFPNVTVLDNDWAVIAGQRFIGGTMWFPRVSVDGYWSDFAKVDGGQEWIAGENEAFLNLVKEEMIEGDVVVSHHLPSYNSVAHQFIGQPTNKFFVTECDDLIKQVEPAVWIFGHTHVSFDYKIGVTRLVANPFGYPTEKTGYQDHLLIKV